MYRIHTSQITVKTVYLKRLTVSIEAKFQFFSIELEQKTYEKKKLNIDVFHFRFLISREEPF